MEGREPKTIISHYPLADSVLLKRITLHSAISIRGSRTEEQLFKDDLDLKCLTVVGYGAITNTVKIGDNVAIDFGSVLQEIKTLDKDNPNSFNNVRKSLLDVVESDIKNSDKFEIHKYYRISMYGIHSIVDADRFKIDASDTAPQESKNI